jgi:hypothetical protein
MRPRPPVWSTAVRAFSSKHRALSGLLGAAAFGLVSGVFKVFSQDFAERILIWASQL